VSWNPDIPAAFLLIVLVIAMHAREIREHVWNKRFFSPERRRLQDVTAWWQERAR
jgi:hypothetical protein